MLFNRMSRLAILAIILIVAMCSGVITGCGGGAGGSLSGPSGPTSVTISALGGSVSNGTANLGVPANTVSTSTLFTLGPATGYPINSRLVPGTAYSFDAGGAFLLGPVTLTINYSNLPVGAIESSLVMYTVVNNAWRAVAGSTLNTTGKSVSAAVQSAGVYGIFVTQSTSATSTGTILFNRGLRSGVNKFAAMNLDGTNVTTLLASPANAYVANARYSANGTSIAYDYTNGLTGMSIFSMNASGAGILKLTGGGLKPNSTNANSYNPSYSSDGTTIVFVSDRTGTPEVYTMTAAGASVTQITSIADTAISDVFFTKAGKIAFYATVAGLSSWYQVNTNTTGLASVNSLPSNISLISPWYAFSPNGTTIATAYLQGQYYELCSFSPDGLVRTRLTTLNADNIINPHYTSDGTKIVFQAVVNGASSIFIVNANGTGLTNLTVSSGPDYLCDLR